MSKTKMSYSLSGEDITNIFDGKIKILLFSDIRLYKNLDELLKPYDRVIILFERKKNVGHWTCLFRNSKGVFFFDPYGIKPENQLRFSSGMNKLLNQQKDTLNRLFDGHLIKYNDKPFQKWENGINTCGRWVVARLLLPNMTNHEFFDFINARTNERDKYITDLTNIFFT